MEYAGLTPDDLDNVRALNAVWLKSGWGEAAQLSAGGIERLASTPFLLFTVREDDDALWQRLLDASGQRDLLRQPGNAANERRSLQAAGLAFLWEIARRNPYAARLVSDASSRWCSLIGSVPLIRLLECAADCDLIALRFAPDSGAYRRLLRRGASGLDEMREAAQLATLQALLTAHRPGRYEHLRAAACRSPAPTRAVADEV